jgi:hypothetical protein
MNRVKKFKEWLAEDFAAVGVPPAGNVSGMGPVTPPSSGGVGSGDAWPSLGDPATQVPATVCPNCKKKKCKCKKAKASKKYEIQQHG